MSQGIHMCNMKVLSLVVRKLWQRLKFLFRHTRRRRRRHGRRCRRRRGHQGYDISSPDIRPCSLKINLNLEYLRLIANASRCVCTYGQSANPRSACLLICCIACWERAISHILGSFRFAIRPSPRAFPYRFLWERFCLLYRECLLIDTSSLVT